ncbi:hypothetical protein LVJ94_28355 [Pendulispora rubella]|uniref:Uncharacterized protein n=1 Tax=Pendulispora rubella TaxID=2741070 RepID=A0ABZ2KX15_9BACT
MMKSNLVRTGIVGFFAATLGVMGCASGDSDNTSSDQLLGDPAAQQQDPAADADASSCKSYSGRAVAATVKVGKPNGLGDYEDTIFVSDTKALAKEGGQQTASLLTVNAGNLVKAGVANASTEGGKGRAHSHSAVANAALFRDAPVGGLLGDVLGEDGRGGTIAIDLRPILNDLGVTDLVSNLFGKGGLLEHGIIVDVVEEDAWAYCDKKGKPHVGAGVKVVNLRLNGKPIQITTDPNQIIDLGIVRIAINDQSVSDNGSSIDAAAIRVTVADIVDVKVARASAGVSCR